MYDTGGVLFTLRSEGQNLRISLRLSRFLLFMCILSWVSIYLVIITLLRGQLDDVRDMQEGAGESYSGNGSHCRLVFCIFTPNDRP